MRKRPEPTPSTAERVTLIVSFLVVALLIAVALFEEARIEESKPGTLDVVFRTERTTLRNGDYYVPYTVFNHGAEAVDAAQIRLEVFSGAGVVESDRYHRPVPPSRWKPDGHLRNRARSHHTLVASQTRHGTVSLRGS